MSRISLQELFIKATPHDIDQTGTDGVRNKKKKKKQNKTNKTKHKNEYPGQKEDDIPCVRAIFPDIKSVAGNIR
jgi:hypothetical protein